MDRMVFKTLFMTELFEQLEHNLPDYALKIKESQQGEPELLALYKKDAPISKLLWVNLNGLYSYLRGTKIALSKLVESFLEEQIRFQGVFSKLSPELLTKTVIPTLINTEKNSDLISEVPHTEFFDMSIIYQCVRSITDESIIALTINNKKLQDFDISKEELHQMAINNIDTIIGARLDVPSWIELPVPFIEITSECGRFASTHLVSGKTIQDVAEYFESDFYVLPVSTDRLFILPDVGKPTLQLAEELMQGVLFAFKETEGDPNFGSFLSNNIFYCDRAEKKIKFVKEVRV